MTSFRLKWRTYTIQNYTFKWLSHSSWYHQNNCWSKQWAHQHWFVIRGKKHNPSPYIYRTWGWPRTGKSPAFSLAFSAAEAKHLTKESSVCCIASSSSILMCKTRAGTSRTGLGVDNRDIWHTWLTLFANDTLVGLTWWHIWLNPHRQFTRPPMKRKESVR